MHRYNRTDKPDWTPPRSQRLLDQVRERIRYLHYSLQTEKAYVHWTKAFVLWTARQGSQGFRHPRLLGQAEVEGFLTMLATERRVAPATRRQALNALLFLYRQVLGLMSGTEGLLAALLYGTGMRLSEGLALRVKDIDFDRQAIVVRGGKGDKDRVVMLPRTLEPRLQEQLTQARALWSQDRSTGQSGVYLPHALERKYPRAGETWAWFWVFPAPKNSTAPVTGTIRRHHLFEEKLLRRLKLPALSRQPFAGGSPSLASLGMGVGRPSSSMAT